MEIIGPPLGYGFVVGRYWSLGCEVDIQDCQFPQLATPLWGSVCRREPDRCRRMYISTGVPTSTYLLRYTELCLPRRVSCGRQDVNVTSIPPLPGVSGIDHQGYLCIPQVDVCNYRQPVRLSARDDLHPTPPGVCLVIGLTASDAPPPVPRMSVSGLGTLGSICLPEMTTRPGGTERPVCDWHRCSTSPAFQNSALRSISISQLAAPLAPSRHTLLTNGSQRR